jgi:hypothetical protein
VAVETIAAAIARGDVIVGMWAPGSEFVPVDVPAL